MDPSQTSRTSRATYRNSEFGPRSRSQTYDRKSSKNISENKRSSSLAAPHSSSSHHDSKVANKTLCNSNFYTTVFGPTADETILVGLETFLNICSEAKHKGDKQSTDSKASRAKIADKSSRSVVPSEGHPSHHDDQEEEEDNMDLDGPRTESSQSQTIGVPTESNALQTDMQYDPYSDMPRSVSDIETRQLNSCGYQPSGHQSSMHQRSGYDPSMHQQSGCQGSHRSQLGSGCQAAQNSCESPTTSEESECPAMTAKNECQHPSRSYNPSMGQDPRDNISALTAMQIAEAIASSRTQSPTKESLHPEKSSMGHKSSVGFNPNKSVNVYSTTVNNHSAMQHSSTSTADESPPSSKDASTCSCCACGRSSSSDTICDCAPKKSSTHLTCGCCKRPEKVRQRCECCGSSKPSRGESKRKSLSSKKSMSASSSARSVSSCRVTKKSSKSFCNSSTSTTTTDCDSEVGTGNEAGDGGAYEVKYAICKITKFCNYTTFEVMKSTKKKPKVMPKTLEGVFVLKNKDGDGSNEGVKPVVLGRK